MLPWRPVGTCLPGVAVVACPCPDWRPVPKPGADSASSTRPWRSRLAPVSTLCPSLIWTLPRYPQPTDRLISSSPQSGGGLWAELGSESWEGVRGGLLQPWGADSTAGSPRLPGRGVAGGACTQAGGVGTGQQHHHLSGTPAMVMCHSARRLRNRDGGKSRGWRAPCPARSPRREAAPGSPDPPPWAGLVALCLGVTS